MIAFHYPPCHGSSGLQRTLAFTRYLGRHDWAPVVLSASSNAYESTSESLLDRIPSDVPVKRALALDAARQLAIRGRYPARFAIPDRWASWKYHGVRAAMRLVRKHKPDAIWSTYPIATAHHIAASVAEKSGLPWVADMRDPMVEIDPYTGLEFPEDPDIRRSRLRIESLVMQRSSRVVFCTAGARRICIERYGAEVAGKFDVIANGYDESTFEQAETTQAETAKKEGFVLLHSGTVYPGSDRGPEELFKAIRSLAAKRHLPHGFRLVFRAPGHTEYVTNLIGEFRLSSYVKVEPQVTYRVALEEMLQSDALLVIQGPSSNPAIPAKLYECFRARRPLFALVHPAGDTAALLTSLGAGVTAPLDDTDAICAALAKLFSGIQAGEQFNVSDAELPVFSRANQTGELARLLDKL